MWPVVKQAHQVASVQFVLWSRLPLPLASQHLRSAVVVPGYTAGCVVVVVAWAALALCPPHAVGAVGSTAAKTGIA